MHSRIKSQESMFHQESLQLENAHYMDLEVLTIQSFLLTGLVFPIKALMELIHTWLYLEQDLFMGHIRFRAIGQSLVT